MKNNMHKILTGLLATVIVMCVAVVGKAAIEKESEETEAEPLVINTIEQRNEGLLTLMYGLEQTEKHTELYILTRRYCSEGTQRQEGNES